MKKRLLLSILLLVSFLVNAQTFTLNDLAYNITSSTTVRIDNYTGVGGSVIIQSSVIYNGNTYTVNSIYADAFENKNLTSVIIPSSVTSIGSDAFRDNQLTNIMIPNSVISIGSSAFRDNLLTNVTIPNSVTSMGLSTFRSNLLTSFSMSTSMNTIPGYTFAYNKFTTVTIPNFINIVDFDAFRSNLLTNVTFSNSVTSIGKTAFRDNQITSINLPNSAHTIVEYAFMDNQITSIIIPNYPVTIGAYAFLNNSISNIVSKSKNPTIISSNSFAKGAIDLIIPIGSSSNYINANWIGFKSVTEADLTPPTFENSKPATTSITQTGFTLETDIDEAGTIYYIVVPDGATAPTSAEVKAGTGSGGSGQIATGNAAVTTGGFTNNFTITGLTLNTAYDVYVVAEDDESTPNIQTSVTKVDVTTLPNLTRYVKTTATGTADGSFLGKCK